VRDTFHWTLSETSFSLTGFKSRLLGFTSSAYIHPEPEPAVGLWLAIAEEQNIDGAACGKRSSGDPTCG